LNAAGKWENSKGLVHSAASPRSIAYWLAQISLSVGKTSWLAPARSSWGNPQLLMVGAMA
jgi:hypothetical protein